MHMLGGTVGALSLRQMPCLSGLMSRKGQENTYMYSVSLGNTGTGWTE